MEHRKNDSLFTSLSEADARREELEKEIEELKESIEKKKEELRDIASYRLEMEEAEVKAKAEAAGFALLQALEESGKTIEEAIELIKS